MNKYFDTSHVKIDTSHVNTFLYLIFYL